MKALFTTLLLVLLCLLSDLHAQQVIESRKFKEYSLDNGPYPMGLFDFERATYAPTHTVALRLTEDAFIYLFPPRFSSIRERMIACYGLNLEARWDTTIKLEREELIFHFYLKDSLVHMLSGRYHFPGNAHEIRHRSFEIATGKEVNNDPVLVIPGPQRMPVGYAVSPDSTKILLYYALEKTRDNGRYTFNSGLPGIRMDKVSSLHFGIYDQHMSVLDTGHIALNIEKRDKADLLDATIDDDGNVYSTVSEDEETLSIIAWLRKERQQQKLSYQGFPDPWDSQFPYMTYLPAKAGLPGRVHVAHSIRERNRGKWETQAFKLVTFDFYANEVRAEHQANISSSLVVKIGKARESVNQKPSPVFDRYLIRDLLPMADGRVWLLAQQHEVSSQNLFQSGQVVGRDYRINNQELLLIGFSENGKAEGALIIPIRQQAMRNNAAFSLQHQLHIDRNSQNIRLLTWESSGERRRGQERLYHRNINLKEGEVSSRSMVYEGRRRDQYYLGPYTLWLNPYLMTALVIDGETERYPKLVLLRLPGE